MPRALPGLRTTLLFVAAIVLLAAPNARAQSPSSAPTFADRWGVVVSVVPKWKVPTGDSPLAKLAELSLDNADLGTNVEATDFRIGLARGGYLRGEWTLSLVRRSFMNGSTQGAITSDCGAPGGCSQFGVEYTYNGTSLTGMEAGKFIPWGTIAQRVQIGSDIALGLGWYRGTVTRREATTDFVFQGSGPSVPVTTIETARVPASQLSKINPTLLGRLELAAAVIVTPNVKVRASGGLNYPGAQSFSLSLLYFFGKH